MKILTWNVERGKRAASVLTSALREQHADILVLTETHAGIRPDNTYGCVASSALPLLYDGVKYKAGENRTTIWSRYPVVAAVSTFDNYTSVCSGICTPIGHLVVYGTILGAFGGKGTRFIEDFAGVEDDLRKLNAENFCLAGDLNTSLTGYTYPSHAAKEKLTALFAGMGLSCPTKNIPDSIDHIAISETFLVGKRNTVSIFNEDKKLSDHIGVCLTIEHEK